jgi:hypothetical protein
MGPEGIVNIEMIYTDALMLHRLHKIYQFCFAGTQQGNSYGFGRGFLWVWIMEDEIFEHSITFCWVPFAGKMPASNILYRILWV